MNQWFFNISKFSEDLLESLNSLNNWPNKVKTMQSNWIGKSFGCEINFKIEGDVPVNNIKCFTTRPDTLFGFSFLAVSMITHYLKFYENKPEFKKFKKNVQKLVQLKSQLHKEKKLVSKQI